MPAITRAFYNAKAKTQLLFSDKYLLCTNTTISVVMSCLGDALQQHYQLAKKEIPEWNKRRSRDVGLTGLLIGQFCHVWYKFLDVSMPGRTGKVVVKKLIADQLVCSPVAISTFLLYTSYMEGQRGSALKKEMAEKSKTLYMAEWLVWPPAQVINFCLLPPKFRVLFDTTVSFGFDWYFSYVKYCTKGENNDSVNDDNTGRTRSNISEVGRHLPFLHIQAGDIVQLKQKNFHLSELWQKCCACRLYPMTVAKACDIEVIKNSEEKVESIECTKDGKNHDTSLPCLDPDNSESIKSIYDSHLSRATNS